MTNKHMKKCSTSLAIKEMQIKMALRFNLTPVRAAIIKKTNSKYWQGYGREGLGKEALYTVCGNVN
jgi:hypothetical protein